MQPVRFPRRNFYGFRAILLTLASIWLCATDDARATIRGACDGTVDTRPRIALISAYSDETERVIEELHRNDADNHYTGCVVINGYRFALGRLRGEEVVAVLTNASIVNASMVTQLTLDRFRITHVIFSGIAGGIGGLGANDDDPATANEAPLGTVVIPRRWGFHQEAYFNHNGRSVPCVALIRLGLNHVLQPTDAEAETCRNALGRGGAPGAADERALFTPDGKFAFMRDTNVSSDRVPQYFLDEGGTQELRTVPFPEDSGDPAEHQQMRFWFPVDDRLFDLAESLEVTLLDCRPDEAGDRCVDTPLVPPPHLVVGGNGVTGSAFVDNARYREYLANVFNFDDSGQGSAETDVLVVDMETTAAAMVAESNGVPFIAIRGVSDLAGGGKDTAASELHTFFDVAAENQTRTVFALVERINTAGTKLKGRNLIVSVEGVQRAALTDTWGDARAIGRTHQRIDIAVPIGKPVIAVDDGTIVKLFTSEPGGLTIYQVDPSGTYVYYYAHLSGYADDLEEGKTIARATVIGFVGASGNARDSHLHFEIGLLGAKQQWWRSTPVNPYGFLGDASVLQLEPDTRVD